MDQEPLDASRFVLPRILWATWLISAVLLAVVGITLFFFPNLGRYYWPWPLAPFNTRLLGAIYTSAMLPLIACLFKPRQTYSKLTLLVFTSFTTYFLIASIGYSPYFLPRRSTTIWMILYGIDSVVGLYYCWKFRQDLWRRTGGQFWPKLYRGQSLLLMAYGLGLLVFPLTVGQWWLWPLDLFHSRLYAGVLLSAALAMELLRDRASRYGRFWFGWTQLSLGGLSFLGTLLVDSQVQKLDWSAAFPWLWQLVFLGFAGIGGWIAIRETT